MMPSKKNSPIPCSRIMTGKHCAKKSKRFFMNKNTLLHRQIHPTFITGEKISHQAFLEGKVTIGSDAFMPKPRDHDQLSVYNGDKFSAEDSYRHYVEDIKLTSRGVLSVTVEEVNSIDPLQAVADDHPFEG